MDFKPSPTAMRITGIVATLAAVAMVAADTLLLFTPQGGYESNTYDFMLGIAPWRFYAGALLGVFALPLVLAGYWHLYQGIRPAGKGLARAFFLIAVYAVSIGTFFHGVIGAVGLAVQAGQPALVAQIDRLAQPVQSTVILMMLFGAILFVWAVGFRQTHYPRWLALFNVVLPQVPIIALYFLARPIGTYFLPSGNNIPHVLLFGLSTVLLWKGIEAE